MKTQVLKAALMIIISVTTLTCFSQTFSSPSSVVFDQSSNTYLVSSPGNRSITRLSADGQLSNYLHYGLLDEPNGLTIDNGVLYIANGTNVLGFSVANALLTLDFTIPEAISLKDIDSDGNGTLYISDPEAGKIFRLESGSLNCTTILSSGINNPGGLLLDKINNRLLICSANDNHIYQMQLNSRSVTSLVTTTFEGLAGLAMDNCGNVYVSSKEENAVFAYDPTFQNPQTKIIDGLNWPADITINPQNQKMVIPNSGSNTVLFKDLGMFCFNVNMLYPENNSVVTTSDVVFQWQDLIPKNINYFEVEYSTDNTFLTNTSIIQTDNYMTDAVTLNDGVYYWRVRSIGGSNKEVFGQVYKFTVQGSSGAGDNSFNMWQSKIDLPYPNPAKDAIFLPPGSNPYLIYIYDENGNLIKIIDTRMSDKFGEINLKDLSNGIYFMKIISEKGNVVLHRFAVVK